MNKTLWCGVLTSLALAGTARARLAPPPPPVPALAPVAPTKNIFSMFMMSPEQKSACKTCFCNSGIGQLASSATAPLSAMTGGLITNRCAANAIQNVLNDKNKPADSAEGAAARIKKSEAEAQARREAIRYLGTVDCNWWPEAEAALVGGLKDPNECVRYEAALALTKGCCCTKKVVAALTETVSGTGLPPETSERVRAAAANALSGCVIAAEPDGSKPEIKPEIRKTELDPKERDRRLQEMPRAKLIEEAREALAMYQGASSPATAAAAVSAMGPQRPGGSVASILSGAFRPRSSAPVLPEQHEAVAAAPDPSGVPATLTSRSNAAAPAAAPAMLPAASVPVERRPFFDGLTRALKGKQTPHSGVVPSDGLSADINLNTPAVQPSAGVPQSEPSRLPVDSNPYLPLPAGNVPSSSGPVAPTAAPLALPSLPPIVPEVRGQQ